ncbi:MAG: hypothetical protein ACKOYM_09600, partial [Actinomycetes bacterium]
MRPTNVLRDVGPTPPTGTRRSALTVGGPAQRNRSHCATLGGYAKRRGDRWFVLELAEEQR